MFVLNGIYLSYKQNVHLINISKIDFFFKTKKPPKCALPWPQLLSATSAPRARPGKWCRICPRCNGRCAWWNGSAAAWKDTRPGNGCPGESGRPHRQFLPAHWRWPPSDRDPRPLSRRNSTAADVRGSRPARAWGAARCTGNCHFLRCHSAAGDDG